MWPFTQWGLDILRPVPVALGQRKQILMACDYFTKWVKAKALSQVTAKHVRRFIYNNIIVRFGVPHTLIIDNGKQFNCESVLAFCVMYGITHKYVLVSFPQANG